MIWTFKQYYRALRFRYGRVESAKTAFALTLEILAQNAVDGIKR